MRRFIKRTVIVCVSLVALVACSGGSEQIDTQARIFDGVRDAFRAGTADADIVLTRDVIDQLPTAFIEAYLEVRDQTAYVAPYSKRGDVTIWAAGDSAQLVMRQGLVTATRGIGRDLASSDYTATLAALSQGSGQTTRRLFVRNDEGGQDQLTMQCQMQSLGTARLDIVERSYTTLHLRDTCRVDQAEIVNDYWIDQKAGLIRQSRQWLGPELGYLRLRMLKDR